MFSLTKEPPQVTLLPSSISTVTPSVLSVESKVPSTRCFFRPDSPVTRHLGLEIYVKYEVGAGLLFTEGAVSFDRPLRGEEGRGRWAPPC